MEEAIEDIIREIEFQENENYQKSIEDETNKKAQRNENYQESEEEETNKKVIKRKNDQNYQTDEHGNKYKKQKTDDNKDELAFKAELKIITEELIHKVIINEEDNDKEDDNKDVSEIDESLAVGETNEKNNTSNKSKKANDGEKQTKDKINCLDPINAEKMSEEINELPTTNTTSSCEVDSSLEMDMLESDEKTASNISLSITEVIDEDFFKNSVKKFFSQTGKCTSSFAKTTKGEIRFSLPLEEDSDEKEDSEELECSVLEMDSDEEEENFEELDYSEAEPDKVSKEVEKFKELCEKLDEYISSIPIDENFEDKEIFISSIKKLLDENLSHPELIIAVRMILNASMKKYFESALSFCKNYFQEEITNETITADNRNDFLEELVNCCDDYFVLFLKSILTDSYAYENLFQAFIKHLKSSLSFFNKFHPFLLLIIFSNYPKSNCILLSKFLIVCKIIFSVKFNSYALTYLQNLKNFLLFSILEVYHNSDVNNIHYTFRKKAARFYSYIVSKYFSQEQTNVVFYLKHILLNEKSKFCSCYGALCAIRALGPLVETKIIPLIFPFMSMKLKSVKLFAEKKSSISFKKTHKDIKLVNSASVNQSELYREIQSLFNLDNQYPSPLIAVSPTDLMEEIQSEMHELINKNITLSQAAAQGESEISQGAGAAQHGSEVSQGATQDESELSQGTTQDEREVSQGTAQCEREVSQVAAQDESEVSQSAAQDESEVSQGAAQEESEVSQGAAQEKSEVSQGAAQEESEVSQGAAQEKSEVSQGAAQEKSEVSQGAAQDVSEVSQNAAKNKSKVFKEKFDTIIPSENIYASLIREELLKACSRLANKYVKNDIAFKKKSYLLSLTNNSVSSDAVEMFLEYFGQELSELMPLKYFSKTAAQSCDTFLKEFVID